MHLGLSKHFSAHSFNVRESCDNLLELFLHFLFVYNVKSVKGEFGSAVVLKYKSKSLSFTVFLKEHKLDNLHFLFLLS